MESFKTLMDNAIAIPGVKVRRREFLAKAFAEEEVDYVGLLTRGIAYSGCSEEMLARLADEQIKRRTNESTAVSFAAGIPGGLALAATIPADALQSFAMNLKLVQEIAYIYGADDFWNGDEEETKKSLKVLGVMMGVLHQVEGAVEGARYLAYPYAANLFEDENFDFDYLLSKIGDEIMKKLAKDTAAKGLSKVVPIFGGVLSGGLTYYSMKPMNARLAKTLAQVVFHYSTENADADYASLSELVAKYKVEEAMREEELDDESSEEGALDDAISAEDRSDEETDLEAELEAEFADDLGDEGEDMSEDAVENLDSEEIPEEDLWAYDLSEETEDDEDDVEDIKEAMGAKYFAKAADQIKKAADKFVQKTSSEDVFAMIEKLAKLRDMGAITEEEYQQKKDELMARI